MDRRRAKKPGSAFTALTMSFACSRFCSSNTMCATGLLKLLGEVGAEKGAATGHSSLFCAAFLFTTHLFRLRIMFALFITGFNLPFNASSASTSGTRCRNSCAD